MRRISEQEGLAGLQRARASYQSHVKIVYEPAARDCRTCPTAGICCTDAHFVNVHITRLEAVAIRETLARTSRLTGDERRGAYRRAHEAVTRGGLQRSGDTYVQTYSCPLFERHVGCLVHRRAKPAPCIQHACYDNWADMPPVSLQWRTEHRIEQLNKQVYGAEWAWLPTPLWLALVDPDSDGAELRRLTREWSTRVHDTTGSNSAQRTRFNQRRRSLPVLR